MRVHEELLKRQKLPSNSKHIWDERLADIAYFEDYLTRQGTIILKFFLYVSRQEPKKRFIERLDQPDKRWKFSAADIREREIRTSHAGVRGGGATHCLETRALVCGAGR